MLITFFCLRERYWTAPSYFPSFGLVKSLYCDIIFVVIKCTVLQVETNVQATDYRGLVNVLKSNSAFFIFAVLVV